MTEQARTILDVGCGRGYAADDRGPEPNMFDFRGPARTVIGVDVDPVGAANPLLDEFRLIGQDGLWPVHDDSCDVVVSDWTLEHIDQPELFEAELRRALRPGGLFIARSVNGRSLLSIVSRLVPNSSHARVVQQFQGARKSEDVFPVRYRMNTRPKLRMLLGSEFELSVVFLPGMVSYLPKWPRFGRLVQVLESRLPVSWQTVIVVVARRRL